MGRDGKQPNARWYTILRSFAALCSVFVFMWLAICFVWWEWLKPPPFMVRLAVVAALVAAIYETDRQERHAAERRRLGLPDAPCHADILLEIANR